MLIVLRENQFCKTSTQHRKNSKQERDCSDRQLFCPFWGSSVWRNNQRKLWWKMSAHSDFKPWPRTLNTHRITPYHVSSIYGLLLAVAKHLSVTSSLLVLFACFTVFSANTTTCYKRREPSYLMTIWSLFAVIIVTGPKQRKLRIPERIPDRKKKPFVSRVQFQLTIIVAHFSGWWGVHNQILLREAGRGEGGGSAPISHPFSFMHHFWQKRYPLWNACYWQMVLVSHTQFRTLHLFAVADPGEGPWGPGSPLIFRPKWGPKGRKKFFWRPGPPYLRVWMTSSSPLIRRSGSATALNCCTVNVLLS